jgi:hypothetical protein
MSNVAVDKKKRKSNKPSRTPKIEKFKQLWEIRDMNTGKTRVLYEFSIEAMARELVDWARDNEDALKLSQYYVLKGIRQQDFHELRTQFPNLDDACKAALMLIGNRREVMALRGKLDASMVRFMMPHYDEVWKKTEEWRAELKNKQEQSLSITVIKAPLKAPDDQA